jgi:hypothetical protein
LRRRRAGRGSGSRHHRRDVLGEDRPDRGAAGHEDTMCVEKRLGNLDHKWIGKLHTHLHGVHTT